MKKIILCLPGKFYSGPIMVQIIKTVVGFQALGCSVIVSQDYDASVYHARNKVLKPDSNKKNAKPFGGAEYDFLLWIDSDIYFTFEQAAALINRDEDFIGGVYKNTDGGFVTSLSADEINGSEPIPADWVGAGFCAMKRGVFEAVGFPWFRPVIIEDETGSLVECDDIAFCHNAKKAGIIPKVDPKIIVKHEKLYLI